MHVCMHGTCTACTLFSFHTEHPIDYHSLAMTTCKAVKMEGVSQSSDDFSFKEFTTFEAVFTKIVEVVFGTIIRSILVVKCIFTQFTPTLWNKTIKKSGVSRIILHINTHYTICVPKMPPGHFFFRNVCLQSIFWGK